MEIVLKDIHKTYGKQEVLKGFTHSFKENGVNIILGESGSGKTTLLNIIALFDNPDSGEIYYGDKNVGVLKNSDKRKIIREYVGYIYQDIRIFEELTVYDNLKLALTFTKINKSSYKEKISNILEELNMEQHKDKLAGKLSGGEKQRVAIGRVLVADKKVILADEPTGALDKLNSQNIINLLKSLEAKGKHTIIVITHSSSFAEQFNNNIILEEGRI